MNPNRPVTESSILVALFSLLNHHKIEYCVVGNTEGLPEFIFSDVDIIVSPRKLQEVKTLLRTFANIYRLKIVQIRQHEQAAWMYIFSWNENGSVPKFLHIDFCGNYICNGSIFLNAEELLENL